MRQVFIGGIPDAPTAAATEYGSIFGGNSSNTWASTEAWRESRLAHAGAIETFRVSIDTAPGAGKSVTFTLRKNSADTAAVVTISDTATSGTYTGSVSYAAGDRIAIKSTQTNTPTLFTYSQWSILYNGSTAKMSTMMGGTGGGWGTTAGTYYQPASGGYSAGTTTFRRSYVAIDATIKTFYLALSAAADTGVTYACSIYKNGSIESSSTLTWTAGQSGLKSVTGLSIDVVPGDYISIGCTITGTITNNRWPWGWGVGFEADTDGESTVCGVAASPSTSATVYFYVSNQSAISGSATESQRYNIGGSSSDIRFSQMRVYSLNAPGAGTSRTFAVRKNGAAGSQTVTISGTDTSGTDSSNYDIFNGYDTIDIESSISGTPAATNAHWAFKAKEEIYDQNINVVDRIYANEGPLVGTDTTLIDSNTSYGYYNDQYGGSTYAYLGQSFLVPEITYRLTNADFYIYKNGSPTGNAYLALYEMQGVFGSSSKPVGSALATSDPLDVSTFTTSYSPRNFTFSGANQITLSANKYYVIAVYYTGGDASNCLRTTYNITDPHVGNRSYSSNGTTWTASAAAYDMAFHVYGVRTYPLVERDPAVSVSDNITITESISSNATLGDINVSDNISVTEYTEALVQTFILQYYVNAIENISITDDSSIFFPIYNVGVLDNISITESKTIPPIELTVDTSSLIQTTEKFTTAYTVKAYDGKTASRWGFIESTQSRSIARDSAGNVYAVFNAYYSTYSNYVIWIAKSTDGGKTWAGGTNEKIIYSNSSGSSFSPKIAIDSSDNIYVVFEGKGASNNPTVTNVLMKKGTFANLNTQSKIDVTDSSSAQSAAAIAIDGYDNLHIVHYGLGYGTNTGSYQVCYRKYLSTGAFDGAIINLTDEAYTQGIPDIVVDRSNNLHVAWYGAWSGETTKSKIHYIKYSYDTQSWGSIDRSLVPVGEQGYFPSIALDSNDKVHIAYSNSTKTRYSNLITGSWATPVDLTDTSAVGITAPRQSIALDQQDNIYVASELPYGVPAVFDMAISRYRNGAWQTTKNYAYSTNYQVKPNLMFAVHPMVHKQPNIPKLGTLGVWVDSTSTSSISASGDIMFHRDIDLAFQDDIYINVHQDINVLQSVSTLPLLYYVDVNDRIESNEGKIVDSTTNPPASGLNYTVLEESYPFNYETAGINQMRSDSRIEAGQAFHNAGAIKLSSVKMSLRRIGVPTGSADVRIYAMTGTLGSSGRPTGTALAISDSYDVSGLTTSSQLIEFTFSGGNQIILSANTNYCVCVNASGITGDTNNYALVGLDAVTLLDSGNYFYYTSSYTYGSIYDFIYYIYGEPASPSGSILWSNPDYITSDDGNFSNVAVGETEIVGYGSSNYASDQYIRNGLYYALAASWENEFDTYADYVDIYIKKTGSPTGNVVAELYTCYGNVGAYNSYPETLLATSDVVDASTVSASFGFVTFTFSGANRIKLNGGSNYFVAIRYQGGDVNNNITLGVGDSGLYPGGQSRDQLGTWQTVGWELIFSLNGSGYSYKLAARNFGFNIPSNAKIYGIKAEVKAKATDVVKDFQVQLIKPDNTLGSSNLATQTDLPVTEEYITYGGVNELWGENLTYADINDPNFGIAYAVFGIGEAFVDHVRVTVQYSVSQVDVYTGINVSANDLITVSAVASLSPDDFNLNIYDSINILESVSAEQAIYFVNIFDSISITENLNEYNSFNVSVFDNINITTSAAVIPTYLVTVNEVINISDIVLKLQEFSYIDKVDNISITESITTTETLSGINTFDSINITESRTITSTLLGNISTFDSINITENLSDNASIINISVFETISITENISKQTTLSDIFKFDSINIVENFSDIISYGVSVYDVVNTSENISRSISNSNISVLDNINITTFLDINRNLALSVFDSISITEVTSQFATIGNISVFDNIYITESTSINQISRISVFDTITTNEYLYNELPYGIFVYESIGVYDKRFETYDSPYVMYDDIIPYDGEREPLVFMEMVSFINKYDIININEIIQTSGATLGDVSVNEHVNITEDISKTNFLHVSTYNDVLITDISVIELNLGDIHAIDNILIYDSDSTEVIFEFSTYDSLDISEYINSELFIFINVIDNITIYENFTETNILYVNKYEDIYIYDSVNTELISDIYVYSGITISESINNESFRFSPSIKKPDGYIKKIDRIGRKGGIGSPYGGRSSIDRPLGSRSSIGNPSGNSGSIRRPLGSVK